MVRRALPPHLRPPDHHPLLILHAENDLRCPISQAEQLYVALKRLGREVVLVRFPDEGHEMSRSGRPRHRLERFRIILDWFARYLLPDAEGEGRTPAPGVGEPQPEGRTT